MIFYYFQFFIVVFNFDVLINFLYKLVGCLQVIIEELVYLIYIIVEDL